MGIEVTTSYWYSCDGCGDCTQAEYETPTDALYAGQEVGYRFLGEKLWCPKCVEKLRERNNG